jgi:phosphatidate cytidylyltransferase
MSAPAAAPSSPSKIQTFFRRSFSTLLLWSIVGLAFGSMKPWAHLLQISALGILSTAEFFKLTRRAGIVANPLWGMFLSIAYYAALAWYMIRGQAVPAELDMALFFLLGAGTFTLQLRRKIDGTNSILGVTSTMLGVLWLTWMFSFTARLDFHPNQDGSLSGAYILLWCIAVTKFTDMGAYITGSLIGKHKMIPHISPAKTWEGFAGALLFALLIGGGLYQLFPAQLAIFPSWLHVIVLSQIVALLAVVGDLAESLWKRALAVKDSGHALPGIGGAMDLIDSLCFTAPAVYLYVILFL